MSNEKKPFSFKLDPEIVELAKSKGYDLPEAIRNLIEQLAGEKKCPLCKQEVKIKTKLHPWINR